MNRSYQSNRPVFHYLLLTILIFLSFFAGLGSGPLFDVDEGAFAEATREMAAGKNYLTTYLNGDPRFDKPILIYWLQLASVTVFGPGEFAFRLPSAIAATVWASVIFLFVRKDREQLEALFATSLMILSVQVTVIAKAAIADALLNCFLALSMFAIYRYYHSRKTSTLYLVYAAIGLGILTKGPIALLIPLAVSMLFFIVRKDIGSWFKAVLHPGGWMLLLLIVLPWYTLEYLDQGMAFIEGFFFKHNIARFSTSLEGHSGSLFYYVPVVIAGIMPATGLFFTVLFNVRKLIADPLNMFCVIWFGFVFLFFSLSGTKLPHYMIYGYTPLFLLMANAFSYSRRPGLLALWPAAMLSGFASLPMLIPAVMPQVSSLLVNAQMQGAMELMSMQNFSAVMTVLALLCVVIPLFGRIQPMYRFIMSGSLLLCALNFSVLPIISAVMQAPVREAALLSKKEGFKIVMWKVYYPSFLVYSESFAEKRQPEPGDVVLTSIDYIGRLGNPQLLYRKHGIILAKVR